MVSDNQKAPKKTRVDRGAVLWCNGAAGGYGIESGVECFTRLLWLVYSTKHREGNYGR